MSKIRGFLKNDFFADKLILVSSGLAFLINIILWVWLAIKFGYSHERVPLHFNLTSGIDYVGEARLIYQIAFLGAVIAVVNLFLAKVIFEREKLFSYFLSVGSALVQAILLVAIAVLVRVIF